MVVPPKTANGCKRYKRPFSALPANALDSRQAKKLAGTRPDGNGFPVSRVVLVARERSVAKVKNNGRCNEVGKHQHNRRGWNQQP